MSTQDDKTANSRVLSMSAAIREATEMCMARDENVVLIGLGVADPRGIFGTTQGLKELFGLDRVLEAPTAENASAGIALGAAVAGKRPIITHQRVEFGLLSVDPIVNQAAKWSYMTAGKQRAPLVFRMIVGRGWGQGPQHSQSLESWFAHIPGLKVVSPTTPEDAKGLLIASILDDNPVIYLEHRWSHRLEGVVDPSFYSTPIGEARVARSGRDITLVGFSYSVTEIMRATSHLQMAGVDAEVIDLRSLRPLDVEAVLGSVRKTHRLLVVDLGWSEFGVSSEIISQVAMAGVRMAVPPRRLGIKPAPVPSTRALANSAYPSPRDIAREVLDMIGEHNEVITRDIPENLDVPDPDFRGPF